MHRQRRGMHELPVDTTDSEVRKVPAHGCDIVDTGEGAPWSVRAGMGESLHPSVASEALSLGIAQMRSEEPTPDVVTKGPRGEDDCTPDDADRYQVVERAPSVEHGREAATWTKYPSDLSLCSNDVGNVMKNSMREHQVEAVVGDFSSAIWRRVAMYQTISFILIVPEMATTESDSCGPVPAPATEQIP